MEEGEREVERYVCDCGEGFPSKTARWNHKRKCKVWNINSAEVKSSSSSYILFKSSNSSCFDDWSLHRGKATLCS